MTNEVDEFLKEVKGETPNDPFIKEETNPLDTKTDTKSDDKETVEDTKSVPFHKDPKVQRYIEKEIGKRLKDVKPSEVKDFAKEVGITEDELTETLVEIIGNDTPQKQAAVKKFRAQLAKLEERGAERALSSLREQSEVEAQEVQQAQEELATAFDDIEEEFDVDLTSNTTAAHKERNDFIDFIKRVSPKDEDGDVTSYPDLIETYRLFKDQKPKTDNTRAKTLSSRTMTRSSDSSTAPVTGKTWKDIDRLFGKINN